MASLADPGKSALLKTKQPGWQFRVVRSFVGVAYLRRKLGRPCITQMLPSGLWSKRTRGPAEDEPLLSVRDDQSMLPLRRTNCCGSSSVWHCMFREQNRMRAMKNLAAECPCLIASSRVRVMKKSSRTCSWSMSRGVHCSLARLLQTNRV